MDLTSYPPPEHRLQGVKVPQDDDENRALKAGFEEDDNEDIAYLNFRLVIPAAVTAALSMMFLFLTIGVMGLFPHTSFENFALNQLFYYYGKFTGFCNNTHPYEHGMYPSILRHVEMKVLCNVFFRVAVCVPMAVRIFVALCVRNDNRQNEAVENNLILKIANESACILAIADILSLALFSIVTIRFDFPEFYRICFSTFIVAATFQMFLRTIVGLTRKEQEHLDVVSVIFKFLCTLCFTWTASKFYDTHLRFIADTGCHGYVSPREAVTEYVALASYFLFDLTNLLDIRSQRFINYARTCSGECEPVRPSNYRPGGKYEHCRAFELRQRQLFGKS